MIRASSDAISTTFGALADPTRRAILERLALGEASVNELAAPFEMSLPAISKHLKVLENAGLISRGRDAQRRPCQLEAEPLRNATQWMEQYRKLWEERFDRLEAYLLEMQEMESATASGAKRKAHSRKSKKATATKKGIKK